jgi:multidrug resistance protein MdtO
VSRQGDISAVGWENHLLKFLRAEMAPTPGRAKAAARIVVACVVTTTLVMTMHSPHASFALVTIFVVSQTNAGASLAKAVLRILGTALGAAVGLTAYIAFLDHPWLRVALMGPLAAFFMFLSQTTTAPYFGLLAGITAIMVMTATGPDADSGLHVGLWRFAMVLLGAVIATGAQMFLWPGDPEKLLLDALIEMLKAVENLVSGVRDGLQPDTAQPNSLLLTGLSHQLDLVDNAEARYPSLRQHHGELIALIGGVEQLLTAAVAFARVASGERRDSPAAAARARLAGIAVNCARLWEALESQQPIDALGGDDKLPSDADVANSSSAALLPGLIEMEQILASLPQATGFLDRDRKPQANITSKLKFDSPTRAAFFTPAFSLANTSAIMFSLRTGLAATLAYVLYEGMAWPGLSTSVWTTIIIAQSTLGASLQKALLRLAGAILGGLLGLSTIVLLMPNMDSLAPLLVVTAAVTALAGWIIAGSTRIAYVGIQLGLAFALCVLNDLGPTTDLVPARDRVIGVLLGIIVSLLVFSLTGGTVLAGTAMRRTLASALHSLAGLARVGLHDESPTANLRPARGWRWKVYQDLATTLRLHDESKFEWGAGLADAKAERAYVARLAADTQAIFLAVLAMVHHRLNVDFTAMPPVVRKEFRSLAEVVASRLETLADQTEGKAGLNTSDLGPQLALARTVADDTMPALEPQLRAHLPGRLALYKDLVAKIAQFERDAMPPAK